MRFAGISAETRALWAQPRKPRPHPPLTKARVAVMMGMGDAERWAYQRGIDDTRTAPGLWWRLYDWWRAR